LNCIRCGACLNVCPVYKNIGGHTYETTYSGPIGSVITPHLAGFEENKHLSYASSLCGACTSVCPVKIPLHNLLLLNRKQSVEDGLVDKNEKLAFRFFTYGMKNRRLINFAPAGVKNFVLRKVQHGTWSKRREPLAAAPLSFNEMWRKQRGS
ncbi:MAG: 4Fe-4S dicluster domain-containing protein, partial [Rufibacter sp.]